MSILEIENFFRNCSFFLLFISMISYWVQLIFHLQFLNFGRLTMVCANFSLFSLLILRWKESGHFPLSNLYESLMFLSWSFSIFHLILENIEINKKNVFLWVGDEIPYPRRLFKIYFLSIIKIGHLFLLHSLRLLLFLRMLLLLLVYLSKCNILHL